MIGIIVVTHATLAAELVRSTEMILGPLTGVKAVSIDRDMSVDGARNQLQQAIEQAGGDATLILTDLFGGTPTNISAEFLQRGTVEILTGVNLPMVIKSVAARNGMELEELTLLLKDYGRDAIIRPTDLLR